MLIMVNLVVFGSMSRAFECQFLTASHLFLNSLNMVSYLIVLQLGNLLYKACFIVASIDIS
jgi:hypothetical protein